MLQWNFTLFSQRREMNLSEIMSNSDVFFYREKARWCSVAFASVCCSFGTPCRYHSWVVLRGRGARWDLRAGFTQLGCESERLAIEEQHFVARFISAPSFFSLVRALARRLVERERKRESPVGFSDFVRRPALAWLAKSPLDVGKMAESIFAGVRLIFPDQSRLDESFFLHSWASQRSFSLWITSVESSPIFWWELSRRTRD